MSPDGLAIGRVRTALLAALLCQATLSLGQEKPEMGHAMTREFRDTGFKATSRVADLAEPVQSVLSLEARPMADARGEWNSGCVVDGLPMRRLIVGAISSTLVAVLYESGGKGVGRTLQLIELAPDGAPIGQCTYAYMANSTSPSPRASDGDNLRALRQDFPTRFRLSGCETLAAKTPRGSE